MIKEGTFITGYSSVKAWFIKIDGKYLHKDGVLYSSTGYGDSSAYSIETYGGWYTTYEEALEIFKEYSK